MCSSCYGSRNCRNSRRNLYDPETNKCDESLPNNGVIKVLRINYQLLDLLFEVEFKVYGV